MYLKTHLLSVDDVNVTGNQMKSIEVDPERVDQWVQENEKCFNYDKTVLFTYPCSSVEVKFKKFSVKSSSLVKDPDMVVDDPLCTIPRFHRRCKPSSSALLQTKSNMPFSASLQLKLFSIYVLPIALDGC